MIELKRSLIFGVAAACATAACKPGAVPAPGALQKSFERVPRSPACAVNLPMEWVSSWPIPTGEEGGRRFVALFYSLDRKVQGDDGLPRVRVTVPRGKAAFNTEGKVFSCEVKPAEARALRGERYPAAAMRLEEEDFDKAVAKFLRLTETVSDYYARNSPKPDSAALDDYWKSFELLAEPALRRYYYEANPAFWEWLRAKTGKGLSAD